MKDYSSHDIRNFAIVGHASCGKTMLAEAMLACSGAIGRMGSIAAGTTVSDYHTSEIEHQISVHASLLHTEWQGRKFNIIDTPGYQDFISEGLAALRVGDFALVVVHASHGVGVGTDKVWDYANHYHLPKMIVVNGLDKEHVNFDAVVAQVREHYGNKVFPMTVPVNAGPGFNQVLDVMRSELITYKTDGSGKFDEVPATGANAERVTALHRELIEHVAESDDSLMDKFFTQDGLTEEEMRAGIHKAIQEEVFIPLYCTSAETNVGVARLMDFIAKYGSSPNDRLAVPAKSTSGGDVDIALGGVDPVCYVFKTMNEQGMGELSFFRVYSGTMKSGSELYNSSRNVPERIGQIFILNGRTRTNVPLLHAGDIGAGVKLRATHTGDTLCTSKLIVTLARVEYPRPNIHGALVLKNKGDDDKIAIGLATLHEEDPTFLWRVDSEIHQTIISGQGELHLQIIVERLKRRFNVDVGMEEPRVPYRETIRGRADSKYRHKKQTGGSGQFAEVWMRLEPGTRDSGVDFKQSLSGTNVDRVFVPSVEKGVKSVCNEGVLAGYRVVDVKVDFYDGKMHPVDSKDIAFQIAGYFAFKEAFMNAHPRLLEPIMTISVTVPDTHLGDIMGDVSSRRGRILGVETDGRFQIVKALVPQKELYRYSTRVRSLTGGKGVHAEEFSHYEELPPEMEAKIGRRGEGTEGSRERASCVAAVAVVFTMQKIEMTQREYFDDHLPHRVNLLITFRERYAPSAPQASKLAWGKPRDLFRCAKDISMLMVRFFCDEMGLYLPQGASAPKNRLGPKQQLWNPRYKSQRFTLQEASADAVRFQNLVEVLKAASRAVAHVDDTDVDHPFKNPKNHDALFDVITWTEDLISSHIYTPNNESLPLPWHAPTM